MLTRIERLQKLLDAADNINWSDNLTDTAGKWSIHHITIADQNYLVLDMGEHGYQLFREDKQPGAETIKQEISRLQNCDKPKPARGSGAYLTAFSVEVLSLDPCTGYTDVADIAAVEAAGEAVARVTVVRDYEISKKDAADNLVAINHDPEYLLGDVGWVYSLHSGDEVNWTDPHEPSKTKTITIQAIEFSPNNIITITDKRGKNYEVVDNELFRTDQNI